MDDSLLRTAGLAAIVLVAVAAGFSCGARPDGDDAEPGGAADTAAIADTGSALPFADSVTSRSIEDVLAEHTDGWMEMDGVEGTGLGLCDGEPCIKIFVSRPPEDFAGRLPAAVEGHRVELEPTGEFEVR